MSSGLPSGFAGTSGGLLGWIRFGLCPEQRASLLGSGQSPERTAGSAGGVRRLPGT